jgi:hypothetical protein
MAGSYNHVVGDHGEFVGVDLLDHLGDAWGALEELYGMIWFLANGDAALVEKARQHYRAGLALSPQPPAGTGRGDG